MSSVAVPPFLMDLPERTDESVDQHGAEVPFDPGRALEVVAHDARPVLVPEKDVVVLREEARRSRRVGIRQRAVGHVE